MIVISVLALAFYLLAIIASLHLLLSAKPVGQVSLFACVGLALTAHGVAVGSEVLATHSGQNLSMLNVASLVSLIISGFMTCVTRRFNGWILLPVVYSFSALLLAASALIPGRYITHLEAHPQLLLHIGLALMAYSVLMIACLFALQLACLDRQLKSRKISHLPAMPPLMTVEKRLFQLISDHHRYTGSGRAHEILTKWAEYLPKFVKVMPVEYRRALREMEGQQQLVAAE